MKNYRNLLTSFALMMFIIVSGFLASCEGPEGPQGPAGTTGANGMDGKDATAKCTACHNETKANVNLAFAQYNLSKHGTGIIYEEEAGRIACGGCHSGDGFREAIATGKDDPTTLATSKINCKTCHPIHKNFDETDFALTLSAPFTLRHKGSAADGMVDFKTGNLCAKCHQARPVSRSITNGFDSISAVSGTTYSRFGPHYGTPANVASMKGLVHIEGSTAYPTSNPHSVLAKGCVSCHMGSNSTNPAAGGHTFQMTVAQMSEIESCKGCHSTGIPTAKATEIKTLLAEYRQILLDEGMLDLTSTTGEDGSYNVLGEYAKVANGKKAGYPTADMDALLNYLFIAKDRSLGAHNPAYVLAIVKNGIEQLKK